MEDLLNKFIKNSEGFLLLKGYAFAGSIPYFIKNEKICTKAVGLTVSTYYQRITVIPNVLIRNNEMAKVFADFDKKRFKGEYYFSIRIVQYWLSELCNKPEYRVVNYIIEDETTLNNSVNNFESFMNEVGFSFFEKFKTLSDFDEWFNADLLSGNYNFKVGDPGGNAKEGLVAAKLNNNTRYEELYQLWVEGLTKEGKYNKTIETLKSLKTYLDRYQLPVKN